MQREALSESVDCRQNIVIIGGTNSGKTTLASAIIHEITIRFPAIDWSFSRHRGCKCPRRITRLRTNARVAGGFKARLERARTGSSRRSAWRRALDLSTRGQQGIRGVATLHASSAEGALHRLDDWRGPTFRNSSSLPKRSVSWWPSGTVARRVTQIARVRGRCPTGQFTSLTASGEWQ